METYGKNVVFLNGLCFQYFFSCLIGTDCLVSITLTELTFCLFRSVLKFYLCAESVLQMFTNSCQHVICIFCPAGSQMGQGLWRIARNQQLQQQGYSGQGYLSREHGRRIPANSVSNTSHRKQAQGGIDIYHLLKTRKSKEQEGFINLEMLPPELSFTILSYLNATDLCLASCVWQDLANDELLWQG